MNIENWLRDQAQHMPAVTPPPGGVDRIRAGIRSRARRQRIAIVAAVAAAIATVSATTLLARGPESDLGPADVPQKQVPWVDKEGKPFDGGQGVWQGWPACTSGDIRINVGRQGALNGNATQLLALTNSSTVDCVLRGAPRFTAVAQSGTHPVEAGNFARTEVPLPAGAEARVVVGAPAACEPDPATTAHALNVVIGAGASKTATGVYLPLSCGAPSVMVLETDVQPAPPSPLAALEASWTGPDTAKPGETVQYVVALHNPTGTDIVLKPCPSYTQTAEDLLTETLLLNCEAVPVIEAGATVDFAMRLTVPETQAPEIKVGWHLEVERGATTGTVFSLP